MIKKINIFKIILQTRIQHEKILFKYIKEFLYRKKIRELIQRNKDYYIIFPGEKLQNLSNLKIKFFFESKKPKIYPLKFCPYRKLYYFEFKRIIIRKLLYKFYFIFNGCKMIDINYKILNTKDGYINVINIKDLQENEYKLENIYDKEIKMFYSMIMSSLDTESTSKLGEFYNKRKFISKNTIELCNDLKNKASNIIYEKVKPILKKNNLRKNRDKNNFVYNKNKIITFSMV